MDKQTLQRLLLDHALGALPEDVQALLVAYVDLTGVTAEQAEWADLAARATAAMADQTPIPSMRPLQKAHLWHSARRALAMAATLVIGVGLGLVFHPRPVVTTPPIALEIARPAAAPADDGFWTSQRFIAAANAARPNRPAMQWTWPMGQSNGETK